MRGTHLEFGSLEHHVGSMISNRNLLEGAFGHARMAGLRAPADPFTGLQAEQSRAWRALRWPADETRLQAGSSGGLCLLGGHIAKVRELR